MNIIIDGYNILKQVAPRNQITEKERSQFLRIVEQYAHKKKHIIYVVFDAGPYERPTAEKKNSLVIVYSGTRTTADDVIKTYIEEQVLKPLLIVTTDRQITRFAARHSVPHIDSLDFYALMKHEKSVVPQGPTQSRGMAHKLHPEKSELDELMQEASKGVYYKEEDINKKDAVLNKASKSDKQLMRILKKL